MADDVILGTVISKNRQENLIVINPLGFSDLSVENKSNSQIIIHIPPSRFPESIEPGEIIRIWGTYVDHTNKFFQADRIVRGSEIDPTGVRFRLQKDRGFCRDKFRGPPSKR